MFTQMDWITVLSGVGLTEAQSDRMAPLLPVQRGDVRVSNRPVLSALLYIAEHGCKWRESRRGSGVFTPSTPG